MADVFTPQKRSAIMSRIKGKNTRPEIAVRKIVHSLGYRFRLHNRLLPGQPDIVLAKHRKVIFVHGCFWHGHARCIRSSLPVTNVQFWREKIAGNQQRDQQVLQALNRCGWRTLVVWQCQIRDAVKLRLRLERFLSR
jgi:DNA mismatch endonuclease (patch repair protein)